jgi:trehalose synthase
MVPVDLDVGRLRDYQELIEPSLRTRIASAAERLKRLRVVHINATPFGGGVAEILRSLVPMMNDLGLEAAWHVLDPDEAFFDVTKKLHNGLQGKPVSLAPQEIERYWRHNELTARQIRELSGQPDLLVLHDAQVLPVAMFIPAATRMIWHCHVDLTTPDESVRDLVEPLTNLYSRCVVSMPEYASPGMPAGRIAVFPPAIDVFTPKNEPLPDALCRNLVAGLGIDVGRPLITQVSRFDPWKDPWGVIDAYWLASQGVPGLQLALVGALAAQDDPEGAAVLERVTRYAGDDPDIHIVADPEVATDQVVNALQRLSAVVLQKSTREGFGLTVSEAMWKGRPVIGGDCGGIRAQIRDGDNGFLVSDVKTCAQRILHLLNSPDEAQRLGANARDTVRRNFLMPRLLADYLGLFEEIISVPHSQRGVAGGIGRLVVNVESLEASHSRSIGTEVAPR